MAGRAEPGNGVPRTRPPPSGPADGNSNISGADYAKAFVDGIEEPEHRRQRFSVAY